LTSSLGLPRHTGNISEDVMSIFNRGGRNAPEQKSFVSWASSAESESSATDEQATRADAEIAADDKSSSPNDTSAATG
jgi:hypothetical protein